MSVTIEVEVLENLHGELVALLKDPERRMVHFLAKEHFIDRDLMDDLLDPRSFLTSREKSRKLVNAIVEAVGRDKTLFPKLVKWFESERFYCSMATRLGKEFDRLECASGKSRNITSDPQQSRDKLQASSSSTISGPQQTRGQQQTYLGTSQQNPPPCYSEELDPSELYMWLKSHQVPEKDCDKIKAQEIGGIAFKLITESDGWGEFGVSKTATVIINLRLKKMLDAGGLSVKISETSNAAKDLPSKDNK